MNQLAGKDPVYPDLSRKFQKFKEAHRMHFFNLVLSTMCPITKPRLDSLVALFKVKELPSGFRLISVETESVENLPSDMQTFILTTIKSAKDKNANFCVALFDLYAIKSSKGMIVTVPYFFGDDSILVELQARALIAKSEHSDWFEKCNAVK
jgi:hypothetical protein